MPPPPATLPGLYNAQHTQQAAPPTSAPVQPIALDQMEDHNTSTPPDSFPDALPYAPLPEPTKPVAELTLDEIALEDLSYIRITQTKETRKEIEAHEIVALYHENALDLEVDMPMVPSAGVGLGVGNYGPWDIYMHATCAEAFANAYPALEVCGSNVMIRSIKAMERNQSQAASPMGISITPYLLETGGYMDIKLEPGISFKAVHKKDIIAMLRKRSINVYRGARLQVKMKGAEGEAPIPMGTGMMTDRINLVVSPMHVAFDAYPWPPKLCVRNEKLGMDFEFKYRLGGKNAERLHSGYDGCKGPLRQCVANCSISGQTSTEQPGSSGNPGKRKEREEAEARREKGKEGIALFLQGKRKKREIECRHLAQGKCIAGTRCGFMHVGGDDQRDGTTNATWESIQCANPRHESGWCDAAPNCIYTPCAERQRQARYAQMVGMQIAESGTPPPLYQ